jgi:hypothetical protein
MLVTAAGSGSETVYPVESPGPLFVTFKEYDSAPPGGATVGPVFVMARSTHCDGSADWVKVAVPEVLLPAGAPFTEIVTVAVFTMLCVALHKPGLTLVW